MKGKEKILFAVLMVIIIVLSLFVYRSGYMDSEKEVMRQEIIKAQKTIEDLRETIENLRNELAEKENEIESLKREIQDLKNDLVEAQKIIEELKQKIEKLWESAAVYVFLRVPRKVDEKAYCQGFRNLNISFSIPPSGKVTFSDQNGNIYLVAYWNERPKEMLVASLEAIISLNFNVQLLEEEAPHPYPLNEKLIPEKIKPYLLPTENCPSDNPEMIDKAKNIAGNLTDQAEIVNNIIYWVSQNIGPWPPTDYLNQSNYAITLLRALGIPARLVRGIRVYPLCPLCHKTSSPEYRVQVWFPKIGWLNYDPTSAYNAYKPYPHCFVEFFAMSDIAMFPKITNATRFNECWHSEMVTYGTEVKVRYVVTIWP